MIGRPKIELAGDSINSKIAKKLQYTPSETNDGEDFTRHVYLRFFLARLRLDRGICRVMRRSQPGVTPVKH